MVISIMALSSVRLSSPRASSVRMLLDSALRIGRELMQDAGPIVGVNHDAHGQRIARAASPFDGDFALGFVHELLHVGALHGMNGNAFAARNIADDRFATNGVAAFGAIDKDIVGALHLNDEIFIAKRGTRRRRGAPPFCVGRGEGFVRRRLLASSGATFCRT